MTDRKRTEPLREGPYYGWRLRSVLDPQPSRLPSPVLWATIGIVIAAIALGFLCAL